MFTRILVPLDGSPRAESAVPIAARIAQATGGSVILLHVVAPPVSTGKFSVPETYPRVGTDEELAEAGEHLKALAQSGDLRGIATEVQTLVGEVAPTIIAATQALHADLVVMCSHGYTGFKRWALGSVAQKLAPHSPVPVLVLRDGGTVPTTATQQPMRVFVPLDGSALSESALEPAAQLVTALAPSAQKAVHLLEVVDIPSSYGKFRSAVDGHYDTGVRAEAKREYETYLGTVARRFTEGDLAPYKLSVTASVPIDMDVAEAIVQTAEQGESAERAGYDLIVMATHGRGGVGRWVLGSVAERVLHATKVPLLIVHSIPAEHEHQEEAVPVAQHAHR